MRLNLSISFKLFLSFFGLLVLALGGLAWVSIYQFGLNQSQRLDQFLDTEAKSVTNRLEGIVEGLAQDGTIHPGHVTLALKKDLGRYFEQRLNRPLPYKTTLWIFDANRVLLGQSNEALILDDPIPEIPQGEVVINDIQNRGRAYRVLTAGFELAEGSHGYFRIGCLLDSLDQAHWNFVFSMAILLGGSLVLLTVLGAWLIKVTLNPVRKMTEAAGRISEQNLGARIPVPSGNDELSRLAATLNRLLAQLEADFAFNERLVTELTHELRTPLTIIRGRNERSLTTRKTADDFRELVYENLAEIDGLGTLLNSILELARIDSKIDKLRMSRVELFAFLRDLTADLEPLWMSKELRIQLTGPPVFIRADPTGLQQIFMNLLNNAWKFAPNGTVIAFRWTVASQEVCVTLFNEGPPVPEEDLELIFKRFFRSSQRTRPGLGSGLGLSIVKSLVTLHKGKVRAYNPVEGGAAFEIIWPVDTKEEINQ